MVFIQDKPKRLPTFATNSTSGIDFVRYFFGLPIISRIKFASYKILLAFWAIKIVRIYKVCKKYSAIRAH